MQGVPHSLLVRVRVSLSVRPFVRSSLRWSLTHNAVGVSDVNMLGTVQDAADWLTSWDRSCWVHSLCSRKRSGSRRSRVSCRRCYETASTTQNKTHARTQSILTCITRINKRHNSTQIQLETSELVQNNVKSHSSILPTCFTSSLEPTSYVTQNSSSELLIPLSATIIRTCRFNLLHTAITFHHFFTVSLWARNLPFQKILSSMHLSLFLCDGLISWL